MYCTVNEVLDERIKEDMMNAIIGDEYIEDEEERLKKITPICETAIADACSEIDGYLGKRYSVPFTKTPQVVNKFAKDIAAYNLVSRSGIDESEREKTFLTRYEAAIAFLLNVAKGTIDIGVDDGKSSGQDAAANGFKMKSADRVFSRGSMRGW
jgi:phage gp36-like protein